MVAFVALVLGLLSVWHFCVLFRQEKQSFASRFAAWFLVVYAAIVLTRAATAVLGTPPTHLFDPSPIQTLYITGSTLALFCLSISAVLMASERTRDELTALLRVDALSGVYTRRALLELADMELARSDRSGRPFSVLMIDIDHFKRVNDNHGHQAGDRVIRDVAQRTAALLRRPSLVGRYGGEEFLAVLSETTASEARAVAERVREAVRDSGNVAGVTVSIGVATFEEGMPLSLPHLIGLADAALYQAKANGRNRVEHQGDNA
jgi:diguanylate cyclase (GGDEF)-like protein